MESDRPPIHKVPVDLIRELEDLFTYYGGFFESQFGKASGALRAGIRRKDWGTYRYQFVSGEPRWIWLLYELGEKATAPNDGQQLMRRFQELVEVRRSSRIRSQ